MKKQILERQKALAKMFEEEGLTDEILKEQIELNKLKNKLNITVEKEILEEEFVQ